MKSVKSYNALSNIFKSRKYFLVFIATAINLYMHHKLYCDIDASILIIGSDIMDPTQTLMVLQQKAKVVDQCMLYQLGILGTYVSVNVARKHKAFSSESADEFTDTPTPQKESI